MGMRHDAMDDPDTGRISRGRRGAGPLAGWPWTLAAILALAAMGVGARILADYQWGRFADHRSDFAFDLPGAAATPPLSERLVVFVIDGLRADVARGLPTLTALGERGSSLIARAGVPSLSHPGWTALMTGAPPAISGVTTNSTEGPVAIDTLFSAARRVGVTTAVAGSDGWRDLFGPSVDTAFYAPDDAPPTDPMVGRRAIRILEEQGPAFLVVHLIDVDRAGHRFGVGDEYRAAAGRADRVVASVVEAAGEEASIVVTSDHGHVDDGGHGGSEDEVTATPVAMAGEGFTLGASGEIAQADLSPTIAAVLGIPRPTHATGELRPGLLDAGEEELAQIRAAHDEAAARFFSAATEVLGADGDTAAAFAEARDERARHDLLARLPIALLVALALAVGIALATHRLDGPAMAVGVVVFVGLVIALFFGRGLSLSLSQFDSEGEIRAFLTARFLDALIAALGAGAVTGLTAGRRGWGRALQAGLGTAAWITLILALGVAAYLSIYGWSFGWRLPDLGAAFAALLGQVAILAVGVGAAAVGLVSLGAAWAVGRHRP